MRVKPILIVIVVAGVLALAVWGFLAGRKELATERERERPVAAPSRVTTEEGGPTVSLDERTARAGGIQVMALVGTTRQPERSAYASVLSAQALTELSSHYAAAHAELDKAQAAHAASHREYERLKSLHAADRNVSDKALQDAEATARSDDAAVQAAQVGLRAIEQGARQQWGDVLTRTVMVSQPLFVHLAEQREVLLQITLPVGDSGFTPAPSARVRTASGTFTPVTFVAAAPRTDPDLQGVSFFYTAPAARLLPGMTVPAFLASGPARAGVIVPTSAVVWTQGKAWVYVQERGTRFERRALPTDVPLDEGWFITQGLAAGERVVTVGAQALLSEEFRAQIQVGEEGEHE